MRGGFLADIWSGGMRQNRRRILVGAASLLALPSFRAVAQSGDRSGFTHGVASGDPSPESVVLWTRYATKTAQETNLRVEVALDPDFAYPIAAATTAASPFTDNCAKVRIGGLPAGAWFHYRFIAPDGAASPTGRTRTLPSPEDGRSFRIAVFSCSNGTSGWFNAYAHAAERGDIDLAVHLGDYIYESPLTRSDALAELVSLRGLEPLTEVVTLTDYRRRYGSYRQDPDLQALHARLPMINVWDDHETANNSWVSGASGHDPATEGNWAARRDAGVRAYYEWLPMDEEPYAAYHIGANATLHRLETRLLGRTEQLDIDEVLGAAGDRMAALDAFRKGPLADPQRTMMGLEQEAWLAAGMKASAQSGRRWQVLAQQTVMHARGTTAPRREWLAPDEALTPEMERDIAFRTMLARAGATSAMDRWDGYPAARARLYAAARASGGDLVTLTGDSHNAWASNLFDEGGAAGVEFAGQAVSSFGIERRFRGDPALIAADFVASNPGLVWCDTSQKGYFTLDITRDAVTAEFVFVPSGAVRSSRETGRRILTVEAGARRIA